MTQNAPQSGQNLSTSMFYMWRCVICIAHADGMIQEAERQYLDKVFTSMDRGYALTADQKKAFADDIVNPKNIGDLLPYINDPAARSQLIYFGGLLAKADGIVTPKEDEILKKLHADQLKTLDMEQIRLQVRKTVADETFRHDLAKGQLRPQGGFGAILDSFLSWLGIDIFD